MRHLVSMKKRTRKFDFQYKTTAYAWKFANRNPNNSQNAENKFTGTHSASSNPHVKKVENEIRKEVEKNHKSCVCVCVSVRVLLFLHSLFRQLYTSPCEKRKPLLFVNNIVWRREKKLHSELLNTLCAFQFHITIINVNLQREEKKMKWKSRENM